MNIVYIIISIFIACFVGYSAYVFLNRPTNTQIGQIKEWLLYAVAKAEKELGSGTGQLKLRMVYDMFITKFKYAARFISFEQFSIMVDMALVTMREMLDKNDKINKYVKEAGHGNE